MNVEALREKVAAAEQKVEKCKGTIARHEAQMEKKGKKLREMGIDPETADKYSFVQNGTEMNHEAYWLLCDYDGKKDDIKGATEKLQDAERILAGWKEKLDIAINEEMVIQDLVPQVIQDFLEAWKQNVFQWYCQRYEEFLDLRADLRRQVREVRLEAYRTVPEYERYRKFQEEYQDGAEPDDSTLINMWPRKPMEDLLKERELDDKTVQKKLKNFGDIVIFKMLEFRDPEKREAWLDGFLEEEKKAKLLHLVGRISDITGPITDARGIYIYAGDLNGVVLGEKGAAKVNTIGAGGYNIQCYHYRMLVHDVSEKFKGSSGLDAVLSGAQERSFSTGSDTGVKDRDIKKE